MPMLKKFVLAALLCLPLTLQAHAAGYQVSVLGDTTNFIGCLAINETTGVGFLAVGDSVALLANAKALKVEKGDTVSGTWSVDTGDTMKFSSKADSANTVTIDVPNDTASVTALTTGSALTVRAGNNMAKFDLEGSGEAFVNLVSCMTTKTAP